MNKLFISNSGQCIQKKTTEKFIIKYINEQYVVATQLPAKYVSLRRWDPVSTTSGLQQCS